MSTTTTTTTTTSSTPDEKAVFFPQLGFAIQVRVMNAEPVYATQDLGTSSYDRRHFIDKQYLEDIDINYDRFSEHLVPPTIPTNCVVETYSESKVVGMLDLRLPVTIYVGDKDGWVQTLLQNVLVVENLPVPLHVSLKALNLFPEGSVQSQNNFKSTTFPASFQEHTYWKQMESKDPPVVLSFYVFYTPQKLQSMTQYILDHATGPPNLVEHGKACANCGHSVSTVVCEQCHKESYCSPECQQERRGVHESSHAH
jgi:hypothetical protein